MNDENDSKMGEQVMKEKKIKKAYVLMWWEEGIRNWRAPTQAVDDFCILNRSQEFEYLYDYSDVEEYIRKNLYHVKSNIIVAKVKDVLHVKLESIEE